FSNLAEWTPMTTSSLGYFFSSFLRSGWMWMQLMQQSVQKSRRTTLPLRSFLIDSGPAVLSQPRPPSSSGAATLRLPSGSSFLSSFFASALSSFLGSALSPTLVSVLSSAAVRGPPARSTPTTAAPTTAATPASSGQGDRGLRVEAAGASGGTDWLIGWASH